MQSIQTFTSRMNLKAISFLKMYLNDNMKINDYCSGYSTIFFSNRLREVISIEHNKEWYNEVEKLLGQYNLRNVDYELIMAERRLELD